MHRRSIVLVVGGLLCGGLLWLIRDARQERVRATAEGTRLQARAAKLAAEWERARKMIGAPTKAPPPAADVKATDAATADAKARPRKTAPSLMDVARDKPEVLQLFVV